MDIATSGTSYESPFQAPLFNIVSIDPSRYLTILFFIVFAVWATYTVIAAYHWFKYGHRSWLAVPAIGIYVFVSGLAILYMASNV